MKMLKKISLLVSFFLFVSLYANASCDYVIGNYATNCDYEFTSISSNDCNITGYFDDATVTIGVDQAGASYTLYPGANTNVVSSNLSGTSLTVKISLKDRLFR